MELSKTAQIVSKDVTKVSEFKGTFVDVFNNPNYKSIRTLSTNIGSTDTKKLLYMLMASIIVSPTTQKPLIDVDPETTQMLIDNIMENYPDVSLEDIAHFTKRLLRGEFIGKEIGGTTIKVFKYDVPTLCIMFQRHYAERIAALEEMREKQSNEHKVNDVMHPDILKMFEEQESFKGIYETIEQYCERNEINIDVFNKAYSDLFDEYLDHDTNEPDEKKHKLPEGITQDDFIKYMKSQFIVTQNQIITKSSGINNSQNLLKILRAASAYDIDELVHLCKQLGLWMIPTKYYHAAKQCFMHGAEIKYRYDIHEGIVVEFTKFLKRFFADESQRVAKPLFITAMIFNYTLNITRFKKYNKDAGE